MKGFLERQSSDLKITRLVCHSIIICGFYRCLIEAGAIKTWFFSSFFFLFLHFSCFCVFLGDDLGDETQCNECKKSKLTYKVKPLWSNLSQMIGSWKNLSKIKFMVFSDKRWFFRKNNCNQPSKTKTIKFFSIICTSVTCSVCVVSFKNFHELFNYLNFNWSGHYRIFLMASYTALRQSCLLL